MKTVVRTVLAIGVLACFEGKAQTQENGTPAPAPKAAPTKANQEPTQVKKATEAEKAEVDRKKKVEQIQKRQEVQDSLNTAIVEQLRKEAQRVYQEQKSKKTGGKLPQKTSSGKAPEEVRRSTAKP